MITFTSTIWSQIQPSLQMLGMGLLPSCDFSERRDYHGPVLPSVEEEILR